MADQEPTGGRGEGRRDEERRGNPRGGKPGSGAGRRHSDSGDRPRYNPERSERRSGSAGRDGGQRREGGFSRDGGQRREGGFSRDGGQRREGGFSRDGGQRREGGPERRWKRPEGDGDRSRQGGGERRPFREGDSNRPSRDLAPREGNRAYGRQGSSRPDERAPRRPFGEGGARGDRRDSGRGFEESRREGPASGEFSRPHNARDLRSANRPDRERSPEIDEDVTGSELDKVTRAEIRNLEERSSVWVAKHLVMAGRLIDDEPELAFQHALAASRRGGRLAVVREAVGLTAYAAGHYGEALREFRTYRRISGSNIHLPVMADCERGLGRPDRALDLARSEDADTLDAAGKVELAIVVSGARTDLGQLDSAVAALEIPQLTKNRAFSFSPRLFRAYADALDGVGRGEEAESWRRQAVIAENALGVGAFADPEIIDLVGEHETEEVDLKAARGTVQTVAGVADEPDTTDGSESAEPMPEGDDAKSSATVEGATAEGTESHDGE